MVLSKEKLGSKELENFRTILTERRAELLRSLGEAPSTLGAEDEGYTGDSADQASADADRSFELTLKNRDRQTLLQIDEALRRIQAGVFGQCESCGESISQARMKAFPFTTLCIECKAELELEEQRNRG